MAAVYWSACVSEYTDCYNSKAGPLASTCYSEASSAVAAVSDFDIISVLTASGVSGYPGAQCYCSYYQENWSCASKWCAAGTGTVTPVDLLVATNRPICESEGVSAVTGPSQASITSAATPATTSAATAITPPSSTSGATKSSSGSSQSTPRSGQSLVSVMMAVTGLGIGLLALAL